MDGLLKAVAKTQSTEASAQSPTGPSESAPQQSTPSPSKARSSMKPSFGLENDPWASPELHRNHSHSAGSAAAQVNGASSNGIGSMGPRTTSTFTTSASNGPDSGAAAGGSNSAAGDTSGWGGGFNPAPTSQFRDSGIGEEGFGAPPGGSGNGTGPGGLGQSVLGSRTVNSAVEEVVTVSSLPDKEGMFMLQHRNYEVASARRNSKVIRRYSDFVWLLDCLHKRYPFRQLPLLPPKRVASKSRDAPLLLEVHADTLSQWQSYDSR
jgi:sorting nexin-8